MTTEPREFWIVFLPRGYKSPSLYNTKEDAENTLRVFNDWQDSKETTGFGRATMIHVREVRDE